MDKENPDGVSWVTHRGRGALRPVLVKANALPEAAARETHKAEADKVGKEKVR
jgi:hypothetical protein